MKAQHVILLHGLCRSSRSMRKMETVLAREGYTVWNIDYPSRTATIEDLSNRVIGSALISCQRDGAQVVHFVAHSLGGILVRSYLSRHQIPSLGRVVMLGPPNQGSEVVDRLRSWWLFRALNGPAGSELGIDLKSTPNLLGPVQFELGVIAGCRSINLINSCFIKGTDDGKVSVERTKVAGMADHIVIRVAHPFMMKNSKVISQTIAFLRSGRFER